MFTKTKSNHGIVSDGKGLPRHMPTINKYTGLHIEPSLFPFAMPLIPQTGCFL
jgi:hypothetical protein